jgi:hypothetical protein
MSETAMMKRTEPDERIASAPLASSSLAVIPEKAKGLLFRMFADPRVLTREESGELVSALREAVAQHPNVSELRVIFGMALCVNLDAQTAMEELAEAVRLAPDSFIAHLKMGELWMRLRVMNKAEDHTRQAALLAESMAQADLARRQAATIRTMLREGIERSGYRTPWLSLGRVKRLWGKVRNSRNRGLESAQNEELDTVGVQ